MIKIKFSKNFNSEEKLEFEAAKLLSFCNENATEEIIVVESGDVVYKTKSLSNLEWEFAKTRDWAQDFFKIESPIDLKNESHKRIVKTFDSDMKALLNFLNTYPPYIERFRKTKTPKDEPTDPDIAASLENCRLVLQKIGEWQRVLEKAGINKRQNKQVKDIQEKLEEIWDVINREHEPTEVSDEILNKRFFNNSYIINEIRRYYKLWSVCNPNQAQRNFLIEEENEPVNKRIRGLLASLDPGFNKDPEDLKSLSEDDIDYLKNILDHALTRDLHDAALYFTTLDLEENISEDRIQKKIK